MNIRDLKYLVKIYEYQHFGKAANACFVSQPTLSMQLKKLEEQLEVKLIERNNKSIQFTAIGIEIAERAKLILNEVEQIKNAAITAKNPYSGKLFLGIIPTLAPYLLPQIIPGLSAKFPKLDLFLVEEKTEKLMQSLKEGDIDAAILALPIRNENFEITNLFNEPFLLAVAAKHRLANKTKIHQSELQNEKVLLLDEGHCLRDQALEICNNHQAEIINDFRATSLETLRHMISLGKECTLMPKLACQKFFNNKIVYLQFSKPIPSRTIGIIWRKTCVKKVLLEKFALIIKDKMA